VQLRAEKEIWIVVASIVVHCCAIKKNAIVVQLRRTFLLHHSYTMLMMYSSQ